MRKIVIGLAGAVALMVALVMIVPQFVNWSAYREEIAQAAGAAIGRTVTINGPLGLRLLPAPALSAEDIHVSAPDGFPTREMASLERLDVRIALAPLLDGRIQVENVLLVRPHVVVERAVSGVLNWSDPVLAEGEGDGKGEGDASAAKGLRGVNGDYRLVNTLSFDQIGLEDARFTYNDQIENIAETVEGINLTIVAGSVTGPFQISGDAVVRQTALRLEATTGRFAAGGAVPLRLSIGLPGGEPERPSALRFAGIIGDEGDASPADPSSTRPSSVWPSFGDFRPTLRGDLRIEGANLSRMIKPLLDRKGSGLDKVPAAQVNQPFSLHSSVEASGAGARLNSLELVLGDVTASGRAGFKFGAPNEGELTLLINRLDLDGWIPESGATATKSGAKIPEPKGEEAEPGVIASGGGFTLPTDIRFRLDVSVDAVSLSGGVGRQLRLEAILEKGAVTIDRLSALLPGGSQVSSAGQLTALGGAPKLDVQVEATSDNLRALLDWSGIDTATIPADRLRKAALTASVDAKPGRVELSNLDLELDTSRMTGAIAVETRDGLATGARLALGARLDIDHLNIDGYLPASAEPPAKPATTKPATPPPLSGETGISQERLAAWLGQADVNLVAALGEVTLDGGTILDLKLDLTATGGAIDAREISFKDWAGVTARISGQAAGLEPLRGAHVTINASAESLVAISRAPFWPDAAPPPEILGRAALQARLAGDAERVAVEATIELAGANAELGGAIDHPNLALASGESAGTKSEIGIDLTGRVRHADADTLLALAGVAAPSGPGPLDLYAHFTSDGPRMAFEDIKGQIGNTAVAGDIRVDRAARRPRVAADLRAGPIDIERMRTIKPQPLPAKGTPGAKPAPAAASTMTNGGGQPIDLTILDQFDGNLKATVERLTLAGVDLDQLAATAQLDDGNLTVDRFDATVMGGRVGGRAVVTAPRERQPSRFALTATAEGLVPVEAVPIGPLALTSGVAAGEIDISATGPTPDDWLRQLTGTARIAVRDGVLRGIDLTAIRDSLKPDARPRDLIQNLTRGVSGGETGFASLDGGFHIDHGIVETNDTRLESVPASVSAVGHVNLPDRSMDVTLTIDLMLDPPPPPISVRLHGPLAGPERALDVETLKRQAIERAAGEALHKVAPDLPPVVPERLLNNLLRGLGR